MGALTWQVHYNGVHLVRARYLYLVSFRTGCKNWAGTHIELDDIVRKVRQTSVDVRERSR